MRGLNIFIKDLRTTKNEKERVDKELGNIRKQFKKGCNAYQQRKYLVKLMFIHLFYKPVEFGQLEAIRLITSESFKNKRIGYLFFNLVCEDKLLLVNSLMKDLESGDSARVELALLSADFEKEDLDLSNCKCSDSSVEKKKILVSPNLPDLQGNFTILLAKASKIEKNPDPKYIPQCIKLLHAVHDAPHEYIYNESKCPWLVIKILKILQKVAKNINEEDKDKVLHEIKRFLRLDDSSSLNKQAKNIQYAVFFEAAHLSAILGQSPPDVLIRLVRSKDNNVRAVAFKTCSYFKGHYTSYDIAIDSINDPDPSIRKHATNLLISMINEFNYSQIIEEMIKVLELDPRKDLIASIQTQSDLHDEDYFKVLLKLVKYSESVIDTLLCYLRDNEIHRQEALEQGILFLEQDCTSAVKYGLAVISAYPQLITECQLPIKVPLLGEEMEYPAETKTKNRTSDVDLLMDFDTQIAISPLIEEAQAFKSDGLALQNNDTALVATSLNSFYSPSPEQVFDLVKAAYSVDSFSALNCLYSLAVEYPSIYSEVREYLFNISQQHAIAQHRAHELLTLLDMGYTYLDRNIYTTKRIILDRSRFFTILRDRKSGILFENSATQFGIRMDFNDQLAHVHLYIGNKSDKNAFVYFSALDLRIEPKEGEITVESGKQVPIKFVVEYSESLFQPKIEIESNLVSGILRLPISATKFQE